MYADPATMEVANWDAGEPIVEVLFQRASDSATLSLNVRTSLGWLMVGNPSEAIAGDLQQAMADPCACARAYIVSGNVGIIIRTKRCCP